MVKKEIEFETLHSNKHRIYLLCGIVCVVVLMVTLIVTTSKAKYKTTESIPLLNGTINYTLADLNIVAMYLDGEQVDILPDGNYELTEDSYCTNEENVKDETITLSYDSATKGLSVSPMTRKGTKCYLYFEKGVSASETILASENAPTDQTTDWTGGTTYYYTGNPNNWVQFGGFWWRIIRINGDGSIRMIYQGTSANTTGTGTQIGTSAFNRLWDNNAYVGYMYTSGQRQGHDNPSTIKGILDQWYQQNLADDDEYIDGNIGFCGDRRVTSGNGITESTDYQPYTRISNSSPSLSCEDADIYTTTDSSIGNKALTYPIGLISTDEAMFAGIPNWNSSNNSNYLYTGQSYWTISPSHTLNAHVFFLRGDGSLYYKIVDSGYGVRPVINLRNDVQITGSGTTSNPFKIETF